MVYRDESNTKEKFRDDTILVDGKELYPLPEHSSIFIDLDNGRIFNTRTENWMSNTPNRNGYVYVSLLNDFGERTTCGVHTAVVSAHLGIPISVIRDGRNLSVDHIDGDKSNNDATNLALIPFKLQFQNPVTKEKLKNRSSKRMTQAEKDTLLSAWESLDNPKRSEFVNEWHKKLGYDHRTIDNYVKKVLLSGESDDE